MDQEQISRGDEEVPPMQLAAWPVVPRLKGQFRHDLVRSREIGPPLLLSEAGENLDVKYPPSQERPPEQFREMSRDSEQLGAALSVIDAKPQYERSSRGKNTTDIVP